MSLQAVTLHVDADSPENADVKQSLEVRWSAWLRQFDRSINSVLHFNSGQSHLPVSQEGEFIEVFLLPYKGLYSRLQVE